MTMLLLLRHAKSSWDEPLPDHQRPLSERGLRDAYAAGELLAERGWRPDLVLCSTAVRTRQTWQRATEGGAQAGEVRYTDAIYEATSAELLRLIHDEAPYDAETLMLIGHGPGLPDLLEELTGPVTERFRTSGLARIAVDAPWTGIDQGRLESLDVPRG